MVWQLSGASSSNTAWVVSAFMDFTVAPNARKVNTNSCATVGVMGVTTSRARAARGGPVARRGCAAAWRARRGAKLFGGPGRWPAPPRATRLRIFAAAGERIPHPRAARDPERGARAPERRGVPHRRALQTHLAQRGGCAQQRDILPRQDPCAGVRCRHAGWCRVWWRRRRTMWRGKRARKWCVGGVHVPFCGSVVYNNVNARSKATNGRSGRSPCPLLAATTDHHTGAPSPLLPTDGPRRTATRTPQRWARQLAAQPSSSSSSAAASLSCAAAAAR